MKKNLLELESSDQKWHDEYYATKIANNKFPVSDVERYKNNSRYLRYRKEWMFHKLSKIVNHESVVLDFACGDGALTYLLKKSLNPKKVYAFDLSQELINIAKKNAVETKLTDVDFICSSFAQLPYEKETFDIVVVSQVFHHFPAYLSEALNVISFLLKKDGFLIVSEPVCDSRIFAFVRNLLPIKKEITPDEIQFKTDQLLSEIKNNFNILDIKSFEFLSKFAPFLKGRRAISVLHAFDEFLMRFKFMRHFSGQLAIFAAKK